MYWLLFSWLTLYNNIDNENSFKPPICESLFPENIKWQTISNVNSFKKCRELPLYQRLFFLNTFKFKYLLLKTLSTLIQILDLPDVFVWKWFSFICISEFYLKELPESELVTCKSLSFLFSQFKNFLDSFW